MAELSRKQRARQTIEQEEKIIRKCERLLRLKSYTKRNKIPRSFFNDGLGELIEVCNNKDYEKYRQEYELEANKGNNIEMKDQSEPEYEDVDEEDYDMNNSEEESQGDNFEEEFEGSEDEETTTTTSVAPSTKKPRNIALVREDGCYEDIYGFVHTPDGDLLEETSKATPNEVNNGKEEVEAKIDEQLQRRLRGQLNRLTASNIKVISNEIIQMYRSYSRFVVNKLIWDFIERIALKVEGPVPCKIVSELAMLIALLYIDFGDEIGGFFIHSAIVEFDKVYQATESESKRLRNVVILILNLHATGMLDSKLLYDVIDKLCETMAVNMATTIEAIEMILKSNGFLLRKDDPARMKSLILSIHKLVADTDADSLKETRFKYILESLTAIKNNNVAKLKMSNPVVMSELIETTLKGILKKPRVHCISGQYSAVIQGSHWFSFTKQIVPLESAQPPTSTNENDDDHEQESAAKESTVDTKLHEQLCRRLRINTPLRRELFQVLLKCNDYIDAACKLINIGRKQFTEVVNLVLHVALNEKTYNAFYVHLLHHLTTCDRQYRVALNFAVRDKIGLLEEMSPKARTNLALIMFHLMRRNILPITCLKVIEFSDMNETCVAFIRAILELVFKEEADTIEAILSKIDKKDNFSKAIKLFINCFMDGDSRKCSNSIQQLQHRHALG